MVSAVRPGQICTVWSDPRAPVSPLRLGRTRAPRSAPFGPGQPRSGPSAPGGQGFNLVAQTFKLIAELGGQADQIIGRQFPGI